MRSGVSALDAPTTRAYVRDVMDDRPGMGALIGFGAAIGVLFMPLLGPLAIAIGAALGVVIGAAFEARRSAR